MVLLRYLAVLVASIVFMAPYCVLAQEPASAPKRTALPEPYRFSLIDTKDAMGQTASIGAVKAIVQDKLGFMWFGGKDGLLRYNGYTVRVFKQKPGAIEGPLSNDIWGLATDSTGRVWVATGGGLNWYDPGHSTLSKLPSGYRVVDEQGKAGFAAGLEANVVYAVAVGPDDSLWIASAQGVFRKHPKRLEFQLISVFEGVVVKKFFFDSKRILWVGTDAHGLIRYDTQSQIVRSWRANSSDDTSIPSDQVSTIAEDDVGHIWVGTLGGGVARLALNGSEFRVFDLSHVTGSANQYIWEVKALSDGKLWVATGSNGLIILDPVSSNTTLIKHQPFSDTSINSDKTRVIYEDFDGDVWVGVSPQSVNYHDRSTRAFSRVVASPDKAPRVVLDKIRLFNKPVFVGDDTGILDKSIHQTTRIQLDHTHTMIGFDFYAMNFKTPSTNQYAYKLQGFDANWHHVGRKNSATYTNLAPGEYIFQVKAANGDGVWNTTGGSLKITVSAPPWATPWAYMIYILAGITLIGFILNGHKKKLTLVNQTALNEKLVKVDELKDAFLDNTTHELRTPLNGIIGLADAMLDGATGELSSATTHSLKMITYSGRRLSNLINDILDHAKLSENKLELDIQSVNIYRACAMVLELSQPLVGKKPIRLNNLVPHSAQVYADENRLQQMLHNLVGNAIKFTRHGLIQVSARKKNNHWYIAIKDTGVGMHPDELPRVFEAFTQFDNSEGPSSVGTGLGMAITKQLVTLHKGEVFVESIEGVGTTFTVTLPAAKDDEVHATNTQALVRDIHQTLEVLPTMDGGNSTVPPKEVADGRDTILVVDDDSVNRMVIKSILNLHSYHVIEAEDGVKALDILSSGVSISLVILDVMMPKMSGYEVSMRIRVTHPIERLPILFLTSKNVQDELVKGFVCGGNSYLLKPVDKHQLLTRVLRHIAAAKTNEKLLEQIERTDTKVRASLLDVDIMEGILKVINSGLERNAIISEVVRHILAITKGQAAFFWAYDSMLKTYELEGQFDDHGKTHQWMDGRCDIAASAVQEQVCENNVFTEFIQANSQGAFTPLLVNRSDIANACVLPVHYKQQPEGLLIFEMTSQESGVAQIFDALNRIKTHVVAAVVKAVE